MRLRFLPVALSLGLVIAGCGSSSPGSQPTSTPQPATTVPWHTPSGRIDRVVLTPEGTDRYAITSPRAGSIRVTAPESNRGANLRMVLWQPDRPASVDQEQCATWPSVVDLSTVGISGLVDDPGIWQPGLALRVVSNGTVTKAISIAQNIWAGGMWVFWVQRWDTGAEVPFQATEMIDARSAVATSPSEDGQPATLASPPWHLCARIVGRNLDVKIWTGRQPEPSYDDPRRAFHTTVPADWVYAGYAGTYAGHLHPGRTVEFTDITQAPNRP